MPDFTDPYVATERKPLTQSELAQSIRISIAHELDAINLYVAQMEVAENPAIKKMIHHIIEEEREHVAEFEEILFILDPAQREAMPKGAKEMEEQKKAA